MKKIVIFGASVGGQRTLQHLSESDPNCQVIRFSDNDANKHGGLLDEIPVIAPDQLAQLEFDEIHIGSSYREEISAQLREMGIAADKIRLVSDQVLNPIHQEVQFPWGCFVPLVLVVGTILYFTMR